MSEVPPTLFSPKSIQSSGGPRYLQLKRLIEQAVHSGAMRPGDALPPEREIALCTELSRVTVRKAMARLVHDGLLVQRHGSGTFVAPRPERVEQSLSGLTSFTEDMARRGLKVRSVWLNKGVYVPSPEETVILGLSAGEHVTRVSRLRLANDTPLAIEHAALSARILPDPDVVGDSLYAALERKGTRPVRALQRIRVVNLGTKDAEILGLPPGAAGLSIERISYLANGRVIEFTRSLYRGDAYDFLVELRPTDTPPGSVDATHDTATNPDASRD